jgi:hypothetical protein
MVNCKIKELSTSKIQWWHRHRIDILIPKRIGKKGGTGLS